MAPVVAVIAAGAMGAAVGRRLTDNGVTVLTSLAGRSAATAALALSLADASRGAETVFVGDLFLDRRQLVPGFGCGGDQAFC